MGEAKGMDDGEPTAFVDESIRPGPGGLYVVAAVTIIDDIQRARDVARKVPPKQRRFHWKDEEHAERLDMVNVLLELCCELRSYEAHPVSVGKDERARTKCLELLVYDLHQLGVRQLVIESRGAAADRRDERTIGRARRAGLAAGDLVFEHRRPRGEPALWLPDALAGATAAALCGRPGYCDRLEGVLTRTNVVP